MNEEALKILDDLPVYERRYIAVVSENQFDERASVAPTIEGAGMVWPVIGLVGSAIVPGGLLVRGGIALTSLIWAAATSDVSGARVKGQNSDILDTTKANSVVVLATPKQVHRFTFLSGSAEVGQIYAANPVNSEAYYAIESYNDDILDHKLSELERILNALGARRYSISFEDADDSDQICAVSAGKGVLSGKADAQVTRTRRRRFERSGTSVGREPVLPNRLAWYKREPAWQSLVESRLEHGRQEFAFSIELENSLKMSAKAVADVQKVLNFSAEGSSLKAGSLALRVEGSF